MSTYLDSLLNDDYSINATETDLTAKDLQTSELRITVNQKLTEIRNLLPNRDFNDCYKIYDLILQREYKKNWLKKLTSPDNQYTDHKAIRLTISNINSLEWAVRQILGKYSNKFKEIKRICII